MILHGDCLVQMKSLADNSVDAIVTDPPYGTTQCRWDSIVDLVKMWEQFSRVLKSHGTIVVFTQQPFTSTLIESNKKLFRFEWIWEKPNGTGHLNAKRAPLKSHENILIFSKKSPTYIPQFSKGKPYKATTGKIAQHYGSHYKVETINNGTRYPKTILEFKRDRPSLHPTQKPVDLLEYLILTHTPPKGTVLDPFMGSGSTGVACKNLGFDFIGIEMNEEYVEIAKRRIECSVAQQQSF